MWARLLPYSGTTKICILPLTGLPNSTMPRFLDFDAQGILGVPVWRPKGLQGQEFLRQTVRLRPPCRTKFSLKS
jgi:hypothetical protein